MFSSFSLSAFVYENLCFNLFLWFAKLMLTQLAINTSNMINDMALLKIWGLFIKCADNSNSQSLFGF